MKLSTAGILSSAVLVGGCSGVGNPLNSSILQRQQGTAPIHATARAACSPRRQGAAACLTLVQAARVRREVAGWTPADIQTHYELPSKTKGRGQIVAIVDAYDNPDVASDLAAYRKYFGLGRADFAKFNQDGKRGDYPAPNTGWGVEIDVDSEMVSAACPNCTIYLIEANSANGGDLDTAEDTAVALGARIVSNSWVCYGSSNCVDQSHFDTAGVAYVAAAGNVAGEGGAPMEFATVASIGGTMLTKAGSQYTEQEWSVSGGCLNGVQKPRWQHDTACSYRAANDASAVASNVAAYDSYGGYGWVTLEGTSIPAPLLAGVFALAGNPQQQKGGRTFWERAHRALLYDVCGSSCLFGQYSYGGGWGSPDGIGAF